TRTENSEKEPDACFRSEKPKVSSLSKSNGKEDPWPNLVIEVAYSESK
ncbi:7533_t:CDS:2, partial [Funneliformis geosporum]